MAGVSHQALLASYGAAGPRLDYISASADLGAGSSKTAAGQSIGPASADRLVVCLVWWALSGSTNLNTLTVGGVSATIRGQTDGANSGLAIGAAVVPSGTTADIAMGFAGSVARCGVLVCTLTGYQSATPANAHFPAGSGMETRTAIIDIPAGGVALAVGMNSEPGQLIGITNAQEVANQVYPSERVVAGVAQSAAGVLDLGIQFTNVRCVGAVSWS